MKIWIKLTDEENRIITDSIYETKMKFNYANYPEILREAAHTVDAPTPLVIKSQFNHFKQFRINKYKDVDFVEPIDFTSMELEIFPE